MSDSTGITGGIYDADSEAVFRKYNPDAVLLIVLSTDGKAGFSVLARAPIAGEIPSILRKIAHDIEVQVTQAKNQ